MTDQLDESIEILNSKKCFVCLCQLAPGWRTPHVQSEDENMNKCSKPSYGHAFVRLFLLSITKFTLWARKGRGITATSDMRLELTRCRKLWKNSGWTYVCMNQSKTQKLKCTSYDLSDFQISVMCGWIGFSLSEKRAIMLHRTGLATSQLLEDKKHIFGLHFVWMPSEHKYLKYLA